MVQGWARRRLEKITTTEVKAMLYHREPLDWLLDDHMQTSFLALHSALGIYLSQDEQTIFNKYAVPIDLVAMQELEGLIVKLPGLSNIALDGATINGKSKVRISFSISHFPSCVKTNTLNYIICSRPCYRLSIHC